MKASDFVTTSEQKVAASERLLFTEQTDAVNTGLVDSADKKGGSALNGPPAPPSGGPSTAGTGTAVLAWPTAHSRPEADGTPPGDGGPISGEAGQEPQCAGCAAMTAQTVRHMAAAMAQTHCGVGRRGGCPQHSCRVTELDGADDAVLRGRKVRCPAQRPSTGPSVNAWEAARIRPAHARRAVAWTECCVTARTARRTAGESDPHRAIPLAVCPRRNT